MNKLIRNKFSKIDRVQPPTDEDDKTQQHLRDEVNINQIIAKYNKTNVITHVSKNRQRFGEFLELADHAVNLDKVAKAQQSFDQLPAQLRNQFNNSIEGFFSFIQRPENADQCVKWGIFDPPPQKIPNDGIPSAGEPSPQSTKKGNIKKSPSIPSEQTED